VANIEKKDFLFTFKQRLGVTTGLISDICWTHREKIPINFNTSIFSV